ncbi:bacterial Ig-like domain-containing protein, partial [uncultured Vagococcus sp.]|uniref:bacterial Ig-like domain-containing protein n=1 Tax=uncultured Vagococcus sp. TaxID=189676 RepID=UPI00258D3170
KDNFDGAIDKEGKAVDFKDIQVDGTVDTTKPGTYPVTYSYDGIESQVMITVKAKDISKLNNKKELENPKKIYPDSNKKILPKTGEYKNIKIELIGITLLFLISFIFILKLKKVINFIDNF